VGKGVRSSKGVYVETPKASTFDVQNALNRDAEGVERLDLRIFDDAVVKYRFYCCYTLMSCHKTFVVAKKPCHFLAPLTPTAYSTNGNLHVLATVPGNSHRCVCMP